ncbi:hypothetical protein TNCT_39451 [Trichonephila clavata]|uniref:Fibrinogen C-terminal domain-containing protein n=1 Tax=Trichonephila clavata TaxID=2740835 RepID=A0A8X6J5N8_TRICU|nr:hypothetical protein TNCT_39451 [Trichonephila clavata]
MKYTITGETISRTDILTDSIPGDNAKSLKIHDNPVDCSEVLENGNNRSGVYTIYPRNRLTAGKSLPVYCDMETDEGGWTVSFILI